MERHNPNPVQRQRDCVPLASPAWTGDHRGDPVPPAVETPKEKAGSLSVSQPAFGPNRLTFLGQEALVQVRDHAVALSNNAAHAGVTLSICVRDQQVPRSEI